ncbi:MAG TPA: hypothetical protein VGP80_04155 [Gemmatimonadales bacterium]|nr:hypothetical protein [Gemmatimonadales bacterium]
MALHQRHAMLLWLASSTLTAPGTAQTAPGSMGGQVQPDTLVVLTSLATTRIRIESPVITDVQPPVAFDVEISRIGGPACLAAWSLDLLTSLVPRFSSPAGSMRPTAMGLGPPHTTGECGVVRNYVGSTLDLDLPRVHFDAAGTLRIVIRRYQTDFDDAHSQPALGGDYNISNPFRVGAVIATEVFQIPIVAPPVIAQVDKHFLVYLPPNSRLAEPQRLIVSISGSPVTRVLAVTAGQPSAAARIVATVPNGSMWSQSLTWSKLPDAGNRRVTVVVTNRAGQASVILPLCDVTTYQGNPPGCPNPPMHLGGSGPVMAQQPILAGPTTGHTRCVVPIVAQPTNGGNYRGGSIPLEVIAGTGQSLGNLELALERKLVSGRTFTWEPVAPPRRRGPLVDAQGKGIVTPGPGSYRIRMRHGSCDWSPWIEVLLH